MNFRQAPSISGLGKIYIWPDFVANYEYSNIQLLDFPDASGLAYSKRRVRERESKTVINDGSESENFQKFRPESFLSLLNSANEHFWIAGG